jgi:hypothetical protein
MVIAPILGGLVADNWALGLAGIPLVFAFAVVLRGAAALLLNRIHETRAGKERSIGEVFSHICTIHPFHGMHSVIKIVVKRARDEFSHLRAPYPVNHKIPRFQPPRA